MFLEDDSVFSAPDVVLSSSKCTNQVGHSNMPTERQREARLPVDVVRDRKRSLQPDRTTKAMPCHARDLSTRV